MPLIKYLHTKTQIPFNSTRIKYENENEYLLFVNAHKLGNEGFNMENSLGTTLYIVLLKILSAQVVLETKNVSCAQLT